MVEAHWTPVFLGREHTFSLAGQQYWIPALLTQEWLSGHGVFSLHFIGPLFNGAPAGQTLAYGQHFLSLQENPLGHGLVAEHWMFSSGVSPPGQEPKYGKDTIAFVVILVFVSWSLPWGAGRKENKTRAGSCYSPMISPSGFEQQMNLLRYWLLLHTYPFLHELPSLGEHSTGLLPLSWGAELIAHPMSLAQHLVVVPATRVHPNPVGQELSLERTQERGLPVAICRKVRLESENGSEQIFVWIDFPCEFRFGTKDHFRLLSVLRHWILMFFCSGLSLLATQKVYEIKQTRQWPTRTENAESGERDSPLRMLLVPRRS